ncbi:hypothetical protein BCR32DRAFT_87041 [Anaeromyces robustus]|uniref:K Homology domain-containing protein n=1 Tax=Anaeromyces robustus TaxID=1754192 RepID=A0A1Y1XJK1_9FUNG|nr:hypothetical protein BCR32DRAFT_87041 [Anaeromyces robustus]|eukprot:ORX85606.1 hypothetical protein BCR32DRAFT_87041 [Anaeromyces robustus]
MMATISDVPQELEDQYATVEVNDSPKKAPKSFEESFPALPTSGKPVSNKSVKAYKPLYNNTVIENFSIKSSDLKKEVIGGSKTSEVCNKVKKNIPVQIDVSIQSKSGTVTIILKGKKEDVKAAKREICSGICSEVVERFPFPYSVRRYIVGQKGATIKSIMADTKTNIEMPPRLPNEDEVDDEEEQELKISGDRVGIELAKESIEKIINKYANRYRQTIKIPRSYHMIIAGPDNSNLQLIQEETGAKVRIPPYNISEKTFDPEEISITGTKAATNLALDKIQNIYDELRSKTDELVFTCNKKQHQFIVGPKGKNLQDILKSTGCAVELPLPKEKSDKIIIRGPPENLPVALKLITEKANSQFIEDLDINDYVNDSSNNHFFRKYLYTKEWQNIKELEEKHNVTINIRENQNSPNTLEVNGKNKKNTEAAAKAFNDSLKKCKTFEYDTIEIPHGVHSHIIGKNAKNINKIKSKYQDKLVDIIIPNEKEESDEIIIIVDGKNMAKSAVNNLLNQIKDDIQESADRLANMVTQTVDVDPKYHGSLIGAGGSAIKELRAKFNNTIMIRFPQKDSKMNDSTITVSGPEKDVVEAINSLKAAVESQKHFDFMNRFSETVSIGKGIGRRIVGGAHIKNWLVEALKEKVGNKHEITDDELNMMKFDIKEENDKDVITCTGHRNLIPYVVKLVSERSKEILDTVNVDVEVENKYHSLLIGTKGKNINEIKQKYNVQFFFPSKVDEDDEDYEEKIKNKNQNIITIKGLKNDVEKAKQVILAQVKDIIDHSHEITIQVPRFVISKIVGRKGIKINQIKEDTDTRIDFDDEEEEDETNNESEVTIFIKGTKKGCEEAKKEIKRIVDESTTILTREVECPRYIHRDLHSRFRSHLNKIIESYSDDKKSVDGDKKSVNGDKKSENDEVRFIFPYGFEEGDELNRVLVRAPRKHIDECCDRFKKLVEKVIDDVKNRVSIEISVPRTDLARIVGTNGSNINALTKKYDVSIDMHRDFSENDLVPITISGLDMEKIEGAKKEILEKSSTLITIPLTETQYLFIMNSQQFNKQRRQNGVFVNFGQNKVTVNGDKKSVENYKANLEKKLDEISDYNHYKQLTLDPNVCSLVIGRGGSNVNRLRKETKCKIFINSRDNDDQENNVLVMAQSPEDLNAGVKAIQEINNRHQNEVTMKIEVPNHLHGRLIGAKGKNLESIKKASGKTVRINFPPRNRSKSDVIEVTGDKKEVKKCIELLEKNVEELKKEFGDEEEDYSSEVSSQVEENKNNRNGQRYIPGFNSEQKINILKSSDVLVDELANAMNYLGVHNYQQKEVKENEWQTIGKKKKNVEVNDDDEAEAEAETSAAKKKNKKKNKKKKAAEQKAREEEEAAAAAEAERKAGSEEQKKKKKKNKKKKNAVAKAEEEEAEVETSTPEERSVSPPLVEREVPVEDEWISIPTKKQNNKSKKNNENTTQVAAASVNAFANLNDDSSEKKKKKNKKKKNNNANN